MRTLNASSATVSSGTMCSCSHRASACARTALHFLDLQRERDKLFRIGLHGSMRVRIRHRTMEPDLSGRTVSGLQSRRKDPSDTYRDYLSDLAHLPPDPAEVENVERMSIERSRREDCRVAEIWRRVGNRDRRVAPRRFTRSIFSKNAPPAH